MFLGYDRCKYNISTISAFKVLIIKVVGEEKNGEDTHKPKEVKSEQY